MPKNPKRIVDAFAPTDTNAGAIKLRDFTAGDLLLLQQMESSLVAEPTGHGKKRKAKDPSNLEILEIVYLMAHPAEETYDLLRGGRDAFDREVISFAGTIPVPALPALGLKIRQAFARATSTVPVPAGTSTEKKTS